MTTIDRDAAAGPSGSASTVRGLLADPSLLVVDDRWYLYPTTDGSEGWAADAFHAWSSPDLVTWREEGEVLRLGRDVTWASDHAWAPAPFERDGVFYLYYTAEQSIGVARSDSPTGPFVDLGRPLVARGDYHGTAIDPSVFEDDDGTVHLLWGNGIAHIVPLAPDLVSFDPAAVRSWTPAGFREAVSIHRHAGVCYATWSENDTREADYRVRWAQAPHPTGPWTDGGVLLEKRPELGILGTGHHAVHRVPGTDDWIIAYHRFAIPSGNGHRREVVFDRLHHLPGGGLVPVVPSLDHLRLPLPARPR